MTIGLLCGADASNLAAYLYLLQKVCQPEYQLIRKTVQRVAPFFNDFHLEPALQQSW